METIKKAGWALVLLSGFWGQALCADECSLVCPKGKHCEVIPDEERQKIQEEWDNQHGAFGGCGYTVPPERCVDDKPVGKFLPERSATLPVIPNKPDIHLPEPELTLEEIDDQEPIPQWAQSLSCAQNSWGHGDLESNWLELINIPQEVIRVDKTRQHLYDPNVQGRHSLPKKTTGPFWGGGSFGFFLMRRGGNL